MAITQYTCTVPLTEWPATPAYTAAGATPVQFVNTVKAAGSDPEGHAFLWVSPTATPPTALPITGVPLMPGEKYAITLADGERVFLTGPPGRIINIVV